MVDGLTAFALGAIGAIVGGTVSGIVDHWLATEPALPRTARWRRGYRWLMERVRREQVERSRAVYRPSPPLAPPSQGGDGLAGSDRGD